MKNNIPNYQGIINHSFDRIFGMRISTWVGVIVSIAISFILASRNLYIALDDENYVNYFTFADFFPGLAGDWWNFLLNEPLWLYYCSSMGNTFGAEFSLRITIFLSSFMFLLASGNITRGAWLFIIFAFLLDGTLATQMYFNQIRQGLALSIFLTLIACGLWPLLGVVIASLIHSSFLLVIPFILATLIIKKYNISWVIAVMFAIISVFIIKNIAPDLDLGRRNEQYEFKSKLTIFYYLVAVVQYGLVLLFFLSQKYYFGRVDLFWLNFSIAFFLFVILMTFIHEASGRLLYLENAFLMILFGLNMENKKVKFIAMLWLLLLLAININEARKVSDIPNDTFFDKWAMILNVK